MFSIKIAIVFYYISSSQPNKKPKISLYTRAKIFVSAHFARAHQNKLYNHRRGNQKKVVYYCQSMRARAYCAPHELLFQNKTLFYTAPKKTRGLNRITTSVVVTKYSSHPKLKEKKLRKSSIRPDGLKNPPKKLFYVVRRRDTANDILLDRITLHGRKSTPIWMQQQQQQQQLWRHNSSHFPNSIDWRARARAHDVYLVVHMYNFMKKVAELKVGH